MLVLDQPAIGFRNDVMALYPRVLALMAKTTVAQTLSQ